MRIGMIKNRHKKKERQTDRPTNRHKRRIKNKENVHYDTMKVSVTLSVSPGTKNPSFFFSKMYDSPDSAC